MICIYGDSHAIFNFNNLNIPHKNFGQSSITMFRIGRDNLIVNYDKSQHDENSIICITYGEIDCRCHIQRQINLGKKEEEVINELVDKYFKTIKNSVAECKKIIVVGIIPPTKQNDYESLHGPITHEFNFVGTDDERVRYTINTNKLIEKKCTEYGYVYFNPYDYYMRIDGTLKYELSDKCVHIGDNTHFLEQFYEMYKKICDN